MRKLTLVMSVTAVAAATAYSGLPAPAAAQAPANIAEIVELTAVMAIDFGLDRVGACERRLFRHERGDSAQSEAGDIPQGLQRGRAHTPLRQKRIEAIEMKLLLRRHARNQLRLGAIGTKHGELACIDAGRAIFARLIDAKHRGDVGPFLARTPARHARFALSISVTISPAPPSERIAFHPAIEIPRKRNCTSSQRTSGAWVICFRSSAVLVALGSVVH